MTDRTAQLRRLSLDTPPSISGERARLLTEFYQANEGKFSVPVLRARSFRHLCQHKSLYLGQGELIVGERGPAPKAVPTFPELTCHSVEDLRILNARPKTWYRVEDACLKLYAEQIIPYWRGRSMRDRMFAELAPEWRAAYDAGLFTEFMEQRAPGHTVLDDKIYSKGMLDFKADIAAAGARLDFLADPEAYTKRETLKSFDISCDALLVFAGRHAAQARELAAQETNPQRQAEWLKIADVCAHVPAHAPRDFHEALQYYWFCHLAVITELNGWDAFNPGHLDQHLLPFYERGLAEGTLTKASARELLECFFIKFNNHPAPPKVGVTAAESGTYTDFANINLGGLLRDGSDGANEVSHLLLDIVDEMHLLQPSTNIQLSRKSPDAFLKHTLRVVSRGYGFPSIFNADTVVEEQLRQGKTIEDARAGGCSGCVEVGAFGKEAYILTGYFNLVKVLELALHNGVDPRTGKQLGPQTGVLEAAGGPAPAPTGAAGRGEGAPGPAIKTYADLFAAFRKQLRHFIDLKIAGSRLIERMYADHMPAPFLSVLIDDCIARGRDYNAGGARYNNTFIQMVGLGSIADCLSAVKELCFENAAGGRNLHAGGVCAPGSARGPRVASGGPPDAYSHQLFSTDGKPVAIDPAAGARYSRRNPPHFEKPWAIYHVTFSTADRRGLAPEDRDIVLNCIRHWDERRYRLMAACVMLDHVHMIIQPGIESQDADGDPIFFSLETILHTIKSFTAHEINKRTQSHGSVWEKESCDRFMRSDADLEEKFHYVCRNPWASGVVPMTEPYPWLWAPDGAGSTRGPRVASGGPPDALTSAKSAEHERVSAGRRNPPAGGVGSPHLSLASLVAVLDQNFAGAELLRQRLVNKTHKYGNDDDYADALMLDVFNACFEDVDGRPDARGGHYRVEMLPTTCHVYFGGVTGAMPDGRQAGLPLSEGISPVQGADRRGPTAVIQSAAKMDHVKTGGTLLNLKFTPSLIATDDGLDKWAHLVRGYFKLDGHHVQFNVTTAAVLREAQAAPERHRDLIVRVAGYSDYFCDLSKELQEEIIGRTEHQDFCSGAVPPGFP
jgi:formate C-acetyltransferase